MKHMQKWENYENIQHLKDIWKMQRERGNMEGFKIGSNNTLLSREYIQKLQELQ